MTTLSRKILFAAFALAPFSWIANDAAASDAGPSKIMAQTALNMAEQAIRHNTVGLGDRRYILAGGNQFRTAWSWDFAFASRGAMTVGEHQAVHDTLEDFFIRQRGDGLLPRTLDSMPIQLRVVLGVTGISRKFKGPIKGYYVSENGVVSMIPNLTLPWAAAGYVEHTGDLEFARRWFETAESAVLWAERLYAKEGILAHQAPFSDWEDSVRREGTVAFTNVLYIEALKGLAAWAGTIGDELTREIYEARARDVTERFIAHFWDEARGALRNFDGDHRLTADANLMAVAYGILTGEKAERAMSALKNSVLWYPMPGRPTWPDYTNDMKSPFVKFGGMKDYHDRLYWPWISAVAAMAERKLGNCEGYARVMKQLNELFYRYDHVGEVYTFDKKLGAIKPVQRLLYRSERPFTWAAGMYLEALNGGCVVTPPSR